MTGILKAELYKALYNKFLYLAMAIVVCFMGALCFFTAETKRIQYQIEVMPDIFLIIICIAVGSIIAQEYSILTVKDMLISCSRRKDIFVSKVIISLISIVIIFFMYSFILIISNRTYYLVDVCLVQFLVVLSQTLIIIFFSIILRNFSAVALSTVLMFFLYHICVIVNPESMIYKFLRCSYLNLFYSSMNFLDGGGDVKYYLSFFVISVIFLVISYFVFLKQDI